MIAPDYSTDSRYRLSEAQLRNFERDSFLNLGQLFTLDEMNAVVAAFDNLLSAPSQNIDVIKEGSSAGTRSVMGWENEDPVLAHFSRDARVLGAVQSVIGEEVVFHQTKYNPKAPNGVGEKWDPHRGITFWHYLDGVPEPQRIVSIFIAVTDQTEANGATYTWTGAHNMDLEELKQETDFNSRQDSEMSGDTAAYLSLQIKPEKIEEYNRRFEQTYFAGPAGTVWLLDSRNLHASQPNLSDKTRILVANVYRSIENYPRHPRPSEILCNTSATPLCAREGRFA